MPDSSNIILVGPMGAGKSAVGRQLARKLKRQFHDSDHDIVARTGVDISFIFEKEGEDGFRKRETEALTHLCNLQNILLSTGGGSVVRQENRELITKSGLVVYLHASVPQQAKRTKKKDNRPLLQNKEPEKILARLMSEREHFYRQVSDLVVNTDSQRANDVVDVILSVLNSRNSSPESTTMNKIQVTTNSRIYAANIGIDLMQQLKDVSPLMDKPLIVITDENLDQLYRAILEPILDPISWLVVPASEESKSIEHYQWLLKQLVELGVKRDCVLLGIGGGVVGDLTGFVAATFMRGMHLIHMPTSLLAMVDSSIGGKTGINLAEGKNLVGSVYQPHAVIADLHFLKTLPEREYISGLAEVIKYGLLYDEKLIHDLEAQQDKIKSRDLEVLKKIVPRCVQIKADIVEADEQDHGKRMLLNLGHTFGHAIETLQAYKGFKHGEAVAIGMCMAAELSEILGHLDSDETRRIKKLIKGFGLPVSWSEFEVDDFIQAMLGDKKNTTDTQRFILLKRLGEAYIDETITTEQLKELLERYQSSNNRNRNTA